MRSKLRENVFRAACFSILVSAVFVFGLYRVFADTVPFEISNVVISQKSETTSGNVTGFSGNKITNNITFRQVGDSVTYKITLKNVSDETQIIDNVASEYSGELFSYEFNSYASDEVEAGATFDFVLKTTYAQAVSDVANRNQNLEIKFVFKFSDGSEMTIVVANPTTWDNISIFGIIFASCIIALLVMVIFRMKRVDPTKKVVMTGVLLAVAYLPLPFVNAEGGVYDIAIENAVTLNDELVVRFMTEEGEELVAETVPYGELAQVATAPTVEGYYFDGWVTEQGDSFDFEAAVVEDAVLTAKYMPYEYNVQFNGNGATSGAMNAQTMTYDEAVALSANGFVRAGYDFAGWNVLADGSGQGYSNGEEVINLRNEPGVYDLFAIWSARNDTPYTVVDKYMTVNGDGYDEIVRDAETTKGTTDTEVTPAPIEKVGFLTPDAQTKVIAGDGSMRIEYEYVRDKRTLTILDAEYVVSSHNSGEYNYGTQVSLKAEEREGWNFLNWSNGATDTEIVVVLTENIEIAPVYEESDLKLVFVHNGACTFNGIKSSEGSNDVGALDADNITGDECTEYADQKYIDTGVKLYSEENAHKDFLVEFTIDEFDLSKNAKRATMMSDTLEKNSINYPGIVVRRLDAQDGIMIGLNVVKDGRKTVNSKTNFVPASSIKKVRIMRKNDAICYAINDEDPVFIGDNTPHNAYFETPSLLFGAAKSDEPNKDYMMRFFNGTLSGMKVRLGEDTEDLLNCEMP